MRKRDVFGRQTPLPPEQAAAMAYGIAAAAFLDEETLVKWMVAAGLDPADRFQLREDAAADWHRLMAECRSAAS